MKPTLRSAPWLLVPLLTLAACEPPPDPSEEIDNPIIGGRVDNGDPAVVALFAQQPGSRSGSLCTSTLIAPTVLLTAAHCVHPQLVGAGARFTAISGPNFRTGAQAAVRSTSFNPSFNPNNPFAGNDFAVAILAAPLAGVTPIPVNRTAPAAGGTVRLIGYGNNDGGQSPDFTGTGAGTKRQVTTRIASVTNLLVNIGDSTAGTCQGDSGGPAFQRVGGVERVIGVTSFGRLGCRGSSSFGRVDRQGGFLDRFLGAAALAE
jgi:secreted trypsin-like serine protease